MATQNHKIHIPNGNSTDIAHPETNSGQVFDFTNQKWLHEIIGSLSDLTTTQKSSLVLAINEIASYEGGGGGVGQPGKDGKTWHITSAVPSNTLGVVGDMHLNTATFDIREKTGTSAWTVRGNIKGATGATGNDGVSSYLWIRYSQNANGSGMTSNSTDAKYLGFAITTTNVAPTNNSDYQWSLIKGSDGIGGGEGGSVDLAQHETSVAPHQYGEKFEWRYNSSTQSLDLVVLD